MISHLIDLLFVVLVTFLAAGLGSGFLRLLHVRFLSRLEEVVVCATCGLGLLSYLVLGLGLCGILTRGALVALLLVTALLSCVMARPKGGGGRKERSGNPELWTRWDSLLIGWAAVICCFALCCALAPPSTGDFDSLSYHLASPKIYLSHHRIHYIPFDHHSNFPFTMEMLYTLGLALHGPVTAKLFHFVAYLLTVACLYLFGSRHISRRTGLIAAVVFAITPVVFSEATTAYVDVGLALFTVLGFYSVFEWRFGKRSEWWIPASLFGGWMMGTKYLGVVLFFSLVGVAAVATKLSGQRDSSCGKEGRFPLMPVLRVLVLAGLIASPWYIKTCLSTGNPVYPFAYSVFHGRNWDSAMEKSYWKEQKSYGDRSLEGFLMTPWRVSLYPFNPAPIRYEVQPSVTSAVGPLYLVFLVPLLFVGKPPPVKALLGTVAFLTITWFLMMQYNRYLVPCLALLSLPVGYAVDALQQRSRPLQWAANVALIVLGAGLLGLNVCVNAGPLSAGLGLVSEEQYLTSTLDQYSMFQWINTNLPPDAKIVTYGEPRGFYLDREYLWGDPGHHKLIDYRRVHSYHDLKREWQRLKSTHVLVNQRWFSLSEKKGALQGLIEGALEKGELELIHETHRGQFLLMRIK
ncbi:MAG: glycosyltransferase family 39 protein [Armatimonadetes bacterium]|nr:glycosyltransferase family 39 protein [Armatimonadota bacterium]